MLTHKELLEHIAALPSEGAIDRNLKIEINKIATQIGFYTIDHTCKCQNQAHDLIIKLKIWARQHVDECHYRIQNGIICRGSKGQNVYQLNLTDEEAEFILANQPDYAKYITRIAADEEPEEPVVAKDEEATVETVETVAKDVEDAETVVEAVESAVEEKPITRKSRKTK